MIGRRGVLTAAGAAAVIRPGHASLPRGPFRILVGFSAGGSADIIARLLADRMRDRTGLTVIVDNKPGSGGVIATEALTKLPPDGNSMVLAAMASTIMAKLTYTRLPYDPQVDLDPISLVTTFQLALAITPALPVDDMASFASWAKANPALASFGVPAPGGHSHFYGLMLGKALGVDMQVVPYRGSAPMIADLSPGQIKIGISALSDFHAAYKGGKVRLLATSGRARSLAAPELPTFAESGYRDLVGDGWLGLYAPSRTPLATRTALSAEIAAILAMPDVRERIITMGMEPQSSSPVGLVEFDATELKRWQPIVAASGFKVE
jgi:tripartite-type tricarboxylate transporter receptor subunit TctC